MENDSLAACFFAFGLFANCIILSNLANLNNSNFKTFYHQKMVEFLKFFPLKFKFFSAKSPNFLNWNWQEVENLLKNAYKKYFFLKRFHSPKTYL